MANLIPHVMKKTNLQVLCLFVSMILSSTACKKSTQPDEDTIGSSTTAATTGLAVAATDWMASLSDNINLARLSIPGSHDACARYEPVAGTAICQSLSLGDQLNAGSRFLDCRCRNVNDSFVMHHGSVYQHLNFTDVLTACKTFFASHPNETIIMSIKEEYAASGNTLSFEQVFLRNYYASNSSLFYMGTSVPNLGAVRGKIVLLRRFNAYDSVTGNADGNRYGIDATSWADNTTFSISTGTANLSVQDNYMVNSDNTKWSEITSQLSSAVSGDPATLYINFTSGYYPILGFIPNIPDVSNTINPDINSYFGSTAHQRYGIIPMDFVDATRPAAIFGTDY